MAGITPHRLCGLSFEWPLSTTNKMAYQRNVLAATLLIFLSLVLLAVSFQCMGLLFCTLLIQCKKIRLSPLSFHSLSHLGQPGLAGANRLHGKKLYFILNEILRQNRSHENLIRKFLHPITIAKRLSHTREKHFIQSEISCQSESVSSQTRSSCCWRLFNLHSRKFVEFPQVYSSFLENQP